MIMNTSNVTDCEYIADHWPPSQEERDRVLQLQAWTILPGVIVALPLTILYLMIACRAIQAHTVSRKLYAMLMNRTAGDLVTCTTATLSIVHSFFAEHPNAFWIQLFGTTFSTCFWSALVTYTTMGLIKFYAVARPLHYRNLVTTNRCFWIIGCSWLCLCLFLLVTQLLTLSAQLQIKLLTGWTGCTLDCVILMYKIRFAFSFALTLLCISTVLFFSLITCLLVMRAKREMARLNLKPTDSATQHNYPMTRLILGVSTFAVFQMPYAGWHLWMLMTDIPYLACHYNLLQEANACAKMLILFRMALDVLLDFATNKKMRSQLRALLTRIAHPAQADLAQTSSASGGTQQTRMIPTNTTTSDDNHGK